MSDFGEQAGELDVLSVTAETLRKKAAMFERAQRGDIASLYARKADKIDALIARIRRDREDAA